MATRDIENAAVLMSMFGGLASQRQKREDTTEAQAFEMATNQWVARANEELAAKQKLLDFTLERAKTLQDEGTTLQKDVSGYQELNNKVQSVGAKNVISTLMSSLSSKLDNVDVESDVTSQIMAETGVAIKELEGVNAQLRETKAAFDKGYADEATANLLAEWSMKYKGTDRPYTELPDYSDYTLSSPEIKRFLAEAPLGVGEGADAIRKFYENPAALAGLLKKESEISKSRAGYAQEQYKAKTGRISAEAERLRAEADKARFQIPIDIYNQRNAVIDKIAEEKGIDKAEATRLFHLDSRYRKLAESYDAVVGIESELAPKQQEIASITRDVYAKHPRLKPEDPEQKKELDRLVGAEMIRQGVADVKDAEKVGIKSRSGFKRFIGNMAYEIQKGLGGTKSGRDLGIRPPSDRSPSTMSSESLLDRLTYSDISDAELTEITKRFPDAEAKLEGYLDQTAKETGTRDYEKAVKLLKEELLKGSRGVTRGF